MQTIALSAFMGYFLGNQNRKFVYAEVHVELNSALILAFLESKLP